MRQGSRNRREIETEEYQLNYKAALQGTSGATVQEKHYRTKLSRTKIQAEDERLQKKDKVK